MRQHKSMKLADWHVENNVRWSQRKNSIHGLPQSSRSTKMMESYDDEYWRNDLHRLRKGSCLIYLDFLFLKLSDHIDSYQQNIITEQ